MVTVNEKLAGDLMNQAMENFSSAMKTGLKVQEEAAKWWLDAAGDAGSLVGMQKKAQEFVRSAVPALRANAEDYLRAMDQNSRKSLDLLKKAYDVAQSDSVADVQAKLREMWEDSLAAVRSNVQSAVQLNTRLMESYRDLVGKAAGNGKPVPPGK
jgi:hypothetical protein